MSDVADEIGVTPPLLLHYFGSKTELITAALIALDEPYLRDLQDRFEAQVAPGQLLVTYVEDCIWPRSTGSGHAAATWMHAWVTALHDPQVARTRAAEDRRWRRMLTAIVESGQSEGTFSGAVEAGSFVVTLFALLDGFLIQLALKDRQVTKRFAHEQSFRFVSQELNFDPVPFMRHS